MLKHGLLNGVQVGRVQVASKRGQKKRFKLIDKERRKLIYDQWVKNQEDSTIVIDSDNDDLPMKPKDWNRMQQKLSSVKKATLQPGRYMMGQSNRLLNCSKLQREESTWIV